MKTFEKLEALKTEQFSEKKPRNCPEQDSAKITNITVNSVSLVLLLYSVKW